MHARPAALSFSSFLIAASLLGCGEPPVDPTIAQAVQTENKTEQAKKKMAAAELKKHANRKAAIAAEEAAREVELVAAAKLPDPLPVDIEAACGAFVEGYDTFMKAGSEKDVLQWWDGRRRKLGEHRTKCMTRGSVSVAACGSVALTQPLTTIAKFERSKAAQMVLLRCDDKFGNS